MEEIGFSIAVLPLVNAAIFAKTSFFNKVGDAHGLTDGVLFAEMVLLLKRNDLM